jgi:hypothetical protein
MRSARLFCVLLAVAGCTPEYPVKICDVDEACANDEQRPGRCLHDGSTGWYCASVVIGCPTGLRWGSSALPTLRRKCVTQEILDRQPPRDGGTSVDLPAGDAAASPPDAPPPT